MMNPAGGNVVVRGNAEGPKCSGMVSTFITQITTVTVHVLHGEPKFALSENHGPLTCECQLHMRTSLDRAQANTSSMLRIILKKTTAHPGPLDHEDQGKTMLQSWQSFRLCCWSVLRKRDEPRW